MSKIFHFAQNYDSVGAGVLSSTITSQCKAIRFYNESSLETCQIYVGNKKGYFTLQPQTWSVPFVTEGSDLINTEFYYKFSGSTGVLSVIREFEK